MIDWLPALGACTAGRASGCRAQSSQQAPTETHAWRNSGLVKASKVVEHVICCWRRLSCAHNWSMAQLDTRPAGTDQQRLARDLRFNPTDTVCKISKCSMQDTRKGSGTLQPCCRRCRQANMTSARWSSCRARVLTGLLARRKTPCCMCRQYTHSSPLLYSCLSQPREIVTYTEAMSRG